MIIRIPPLIANLFPDNFVIRKNELGWMTSDLFYLYFTNHVYPWCVKNKVKFPIVFYVDGHSFHLSEALREEGTDFLPKNRFFFYRFKLFFSPFSTQKPTPNVKIFM